MQPLLHLPNTWVMLVILERPDLTHLRKHLRFKEEELRLLANPSSGSGTPYLDASGVVGASVIAAAVFGGIAGAFLIRGRSGKYAAMGRG